MEVQSKEEVITITETAANQINSVIEAQETENLFLRLYVQGGCSGIQYGMAIDARFQEGDADYQIGNIRVVVDRISQPYVEGVTVDFDNSGAKPGFRVTHPNPEILAAAGGSCGSGSCGSGSCGSGGCC